MLTVPEEIGNIAGGEASTVGWRLMKTRQLITRSPSPEGNNNIARRRGQLLRRALSPHANHESLPLFGGRLGNRLRQRGQSISSAATGGVGLYTGSAQREHRLLGPGRADVWQQLLGR